MIKKPVYELKSSWTDGDVISDIYMTKKSVLDEVAGLLEETDEITKIEIEVVGTIE